MWIDKGSYTGSSLETYLSGSSVGAKVAVSSHVARSIAYSANGVTMRQKETVETVEFRGLTQAAAEELVTLSADNTSSTTYYKEITANVDYAVVAVMTGTKYDYVASRSNEADGWHVTKTTTTYAADPVGTGWTTTQPTVSATGVVVNRSARKTFLAWNLGGSAIYQNETTVVREYPFLTQSEAQTLCGTGTGGLSAANSRVYDIKLAVSWSSSEGVTAWKTIQVRGGGTDGSTAATDTVTDMRYEGVERGWTVTATSTTYQGSTS